MPRNADSIPRSERRPQKCRRRNAQGNTKRRWRPSAASAAEWRQQQAFHNSTLRTVRRTVKKWVYFFGAGKAEGDGTWRDLLGGKGAGLAEMTKIGLPVPAGFTISTEVCDFFYKNGKKYPPTLRKEVAAHVARLEKVTRKKLGDPRSPLLVSVRSGSARSMPGMMETILNLGLNERS